jgi:hypothetical protein
MGSRDPESLLPHLYPEPGGDPGQAGALEGRLLARYDARGARRPSRRVPLRWVALACAALSGAALAMSVPTRYALEVGKHVVLRVGSREQADAAAPLLGQIAREGGAQVSEIWARCLIRGAGAGAELEAEIWGDRLPADAVLAQKLRERIPGAQVEVRPLAGPVRASLGRRLATALLRRDATPEERAAARAALIEQLRQEHGPDHRYQVEVRDGEGGRHEVRVKVLSGPDHPVPP